MPPAIYSSTALGIGSDANYDAQSDAYDGSPTKVEPSAGAIAQGLLRPGRQIPAQHQTWLLSQFAAIMSQLITDGATQDGRLAADDVLLASHTAELATHQNYIDNLSPRLHVAEFLASGTWVVPARCTSAMVFACGGGGAGGTAWMAGAIGDDHWMPGCGGGGGALASTVPLFGLTPGVALNVDIGAGGVRSTTGSTWGANGGDTIVRANTSVLARFKGAEGGHADMGNAAAYPSIVMFVLGGGPVRDVRYVTVGDSGQGIRYDKQFGAVFGTTGQSIQFPLQPAQGGWGSGGIPSGGAGPGSLNPLSIGGTWVGGAGGQLGTDGTVNSGVGSGTNLARRSGGPGGGGGAGPFGNGAAGGSAVDGDPEGGGTTVLAHATGYDALVNSGAGGGGSSWGWADQSGYDPDYVAHLNANGYGGSGGSGRCYIIWVEETS